MSELGNHFRRGKLEVARSIIEELRRVYQGTAIGDNLSQAFYAVNRADAALIEVSPTKSHNKRVTARRARPKSPKATS